MSVGVGLDDDNRCSLDMLRNWLSTQPSPIHTAKCRPGTVGKTDIFFIIECPIMGG